jgi:hypothetical protein
MVSEDRKLRLAGYEIYGFGGSELPSDDADSQARVRAFFRELLHRHDVGH